MRFSEAFTERIREHLETSREVIESLLRLFLSVFSKFVSRGLKAISLAFFLWYRTQGFSNTVVSMISVLRGSEVTLIGDFLWYLDL